VGLEQEIMMLELFLFPNCVTEIDFRKFLGFALQL